MVFREMGGESFKLEANIAPHNNDQAYNLIESKLEEQQKYIKTAYVLDFCRVY